MKQLISRGDREKVAGNLQIEMMGYNSKNDGKFHVITCDRADSLFIGSVFQEVAKRLSLGTVSIPTPGPTPPKNSSTWPR